MSGETQTQATKLRNGFEETIRDFWASRPRRPHGNRKIAGVGAAIGNRYGIDPVVVRVALVAATLFGGAGLVLYLLGWLFFPDERDEVSAFESLIGRGRSSVSKGFTVMLCVAVLPVTSWAFSGGWGSTGWFDGGGLLGLALLAAALYLLHHNRGQYNRPVVQTRPGPAYGPGGFDAAFSMTDAEAGTAATDPAAPPAWDPLGAAPTAWDLPDPHPVSAPVPPPPPPRRPVAPRNKTVGFTTFGVALLVAGVGVALNLSGNPYFSLQHVIGLTLAVVGLGLVAGAFLRGGRGLIGLAIPLAIAGMALTTVPAFDLKGGFGDINATPANTSEVNPLYQHSAGNIELDLTKLPGTADVKTKLVTGAGNATVIVPPTADVTFSCQTTVGNADCLGRNQSGIANKPITGVDLGTDSLGGAKINVTLQNSAGNVEVRRG
jgi:phage shock protein PspC (stress-responsive transcriptional regulator)